MCQNILVVSFFYGFPYPQKLCRYIDSPAGVNVVFNVKAFKTLLRHYPEWGHYFLLSKHKANATELHPKVRQTCSLSKN